MQSSGPSTLPSQSVAEKEAKHRKKLDGAPTPSPRFLRKIFLKKDLRVDLMRAMVG